jgi:hypothetical protein
VKRIAKLLVTCVLASVLGCGGGVKEKKSRPEPAVLTSPDRFGPSDPVQALHWLINSYQPLLSAPVADSAGRKREERLWKETVGKLRGVRVTWPMEAGKLSEGKVSPRRISHPYEEMALLDDPDLPGAESMFVLEPMTASEPPEGTFEVSGLPEWLQQVQVGVPILLEGTIQSVVVDFQTDSGKSIRRFKVLLAGGVIKQR